MRFLGQSRAVLLFALLLLSSLVTLFTPSIANAVSDYDNVVSLTPNLKLKTNDVSCPTGNEIDISLNFETIVRDAIEVWVIANPGNEGFLDDWDDKEVYFVTQALSANNQKSVAIYYSTTAPPISQLNFTGAPADPRLTSSAVPTRLVVISTVGDAFGGCDVTARQSSQANSGFSYSEADFTTNKLFISTWPVAYPTGYDGPDLPSAYNPVNTMPDFEYTIDGKNVKANYIGNLTGYTCGQAHWSLFNIGTSEFVDEQDLPILETYKFKVADYENYFLNLQVGQVPCANISDTRTQSINIDGSTFTSTTGDTDCDIDGLCDQYSPYEDCSTYGLDLIGGFGCIMNNFGVFLKGILTFLFIPSTSVLEEFSTTMSTFFGTKFGFLGTAITSVGLFIQNIIDNIGVSNPVLAPEGELWGEPISFDMSAGEDIIGEDNWLLMLTIIRAVTAIAIMFGVYKTYMHFISEGKE